MKKQRTVLIVLAVLLVACTGAYVGLRIWNGGSGEREDAGQIRVAAISDATEIHFTNQYGTFSFQKEGDTWSYTDDPAFPLDSSYLETLASTLADLPAVRMFHQPDALAGYGLDMPAATVSAGNGTGEQVTVLIGNAAGSNYYAKTEGAEAVYTISSALPDAIQYQLNDLALIEGIPTALEESLEQVQVTQGGQSVLLTKKTVAVGSEVEPAPSGEPVGSAAPATEYQWYLDGQQLERDNTLGSALSALAAMSFSACYDYQPDAAALAACGLDNPTQVAVACTGDSYSLEIGRADADGDYYARLNGDGAVYLLDATSAGALIGLMALASTAS